MTSNIVVSLPKKVKPVYFTPKRHAEQTFLESAGYFGQMPDGEKQAIFYFVIKLPLLRVMLPTY
ncbi:hypothetical protein [Citrobacter amalonaticus]|uniref:hypothetical protein n=1 Tax=Citrobacter amalonaticus TaxID=35703 RepID=UPI0018AB2AB0|nr:hypothetical protein [Citrobacter amalonaticus]